MLHADIVATLQAHGVSAAIVDSICDVLEHEIFGSEFDVFDAVGNILTIEQNLEPNVAHTICAHIFRALGPQRRSVASFNHAPHSSGDRSFLDECEWKRE